MDDSQVKDVITNSVKTIIENSSSEKKLNKLKALHNSKAHFIPKGYRILGGILQSMNIQFGNFIEILMRSLIENDERYEILANYSVKKSNKFKISISNESLIDRYITDCQTTENDENIEARFIELMKKIVSDEDNDLKNFRHDIDLLFRKKDTGKIYYLEMKYHDDHDSGKFVDINRKFIKTYAYLTKEFQIKKYDDVVPILFFFTNKRRLGNIYIPESTNIRRGESFFSEFLNIKYSTIEKYMTEVSEDKETIDMFNKLYKTIIEDKM